MKGARCPQHVIAAKQPIWLSCVLATFLRIEMPDEVPTLPPSADREVQLRQLEVQQEGQRLRHRQFFYGSVFVALALGLAPIGLSLYQAVIGYFDGIRNREWTQITHQQEQVREAANIGLSESIDVRIRQASLYAAIGASNYRQQWEEHRQRLVAERHNLRSELLQLTRDYTEATSDLDRGIISMRMTWIQREITTRDPEQGQPQPPRQPPVSSSPINNASNAPPQAPSTASTACIPRDLSTVLVHWFDVRYGGYEGSASYDQPFRSDLFHTAILEYYKQVLGRDVNLSLIRDLRILRAELLLPPERVHPVQFVNRGASRVTQIDDTQWRLVAWVGSGRGQTPWIQPGVRATLSWVEGCPQQSQR